MQTSHEVTSCADRGTLRGLVEEALATSSHADPRLVAADLVAALPEQQLRRLVHERRIPFYKLGAKVRFDLNELDAWLQAQAVAS